MSKILLEQKDSGRRSKQKAGRGRCRNLFLRFLGAMLAYILQFIHILVDRFLEFVLQIYWGEKQTPPPPEDNLVTKSTMEVAKMIKEKKVKCHDVVQAYIEHMKAVNKVLNAVVDGPFEEALEEARKIDERIDKGQISEDEFSEKILLGVPFTAKDSTAVKGKLHTLGLVSRKNCRAEEDAEMVRLMKEAGALIIATSNVPEVNKWMETRNILFGQTNNPYDSRRSVGGSSGGEASLIAACATSFGLGTDIGGSIRIPAFCCGVFGHKASNGVINMRGVTLRKGTETNTMVTGGPMTRYATDLLPLFKILVGPKNSIMLKLDDKVNVKSLRYYYIPQNNDLRTNPVNKETRETMMKVVDYFSNLTGEKVILASLPGMNQMMKAWRYWMTQEPSDYNVLLGDGVILNPFVELFKKLTFQSNFTMAAIYSLIDSVLPAENAEKIKKLTKKCEEALNELLGDDGILFYQSSPRTAPFHYYNLVKFTDFSYFNIFNVLKVPCTQIPMGLDSNGLPLGIQVVATNNRDSHCLAVAEEIERALGGWVPPFITK